jgi:hypothetical protein
MIKAFSTVILLLFLIPADLSFAQVNAGGTKIYSGYLHHYSVKGKRSFWQVLFGTKPHPQEEVVHDRQFSIEFKSPVSFNHQSVSVLPEQLTYLIRFKNGPGSSFEKFIIKIYTNDDEEYSIDPASEGKQVGINNEHHIFDSYLMYLILGSNIDHLEIMSSSAGEKDKYVLDKLEIRDNP